MSTVDKIRTQKKLMDEWLDGHRNLEEIVESLKKESALVGYNYEGFGGHSHRNVETLPDTLKSKFLEIAKQELKEFEEIGYDGWLKGRE